MFGYSYLQEQGLTILEVSNGKGTRARFVPARGGILAELDLSGVTVFYLDKETLYNPDKNIRGGNPVLFPICGPLKDGQYEVGEKIYTMGQHGLARNMQWNVEEITCSPDNCQVKLTLDSNPASKESFPFDFRLEFVYELTSYDVTIRQKYINKSSAPMPFYAGFHPYFYVQGVKLDKLNVPAERYRDIRAGSSHDFESDIDFQAIPETNLVFANLTHNRAGLERADGHNIDVVFDKWFRYVVLWVLRDRDFVCVEPWMGDNYDMNHDKALTVNPGGHVKAEVSYKVT